MNRLTKKISLVLVSGSLALGGCREEPPVPAEAPLKGEKDEQNPNAPGAASGPSSATHTGSSYHGGHTSVVPMFFGGGRSSVMPSSGISASPSTGSSSHSTTTTSHSVGSSRGGFGSSAHAVSS